MKTEGHLGRCHLKAAQVTPPTSSSPPSDTTSDASSMAEEFLVRLLVRPIPDYKPTAGTQISFLTDDWQSFMGRYYPQGDKTSTFTVYGYATADTLAQVLKQCGDELTRENIMKQAASLHNLQLGLLLPGIAANTGPHDYAPIKQMQMAKFNGERWELFGPVINGATSAS